MAINTLAVATGGFYSQPLNTLCVATEGYVCDVTPVIPPNYAVFPGTGIADESLEERRRQEQEKLAIALLLLDEDY